MTTRQPVVTVLGNHRDDRLEVMTNAVTAAPPLAGASAFAAICSAYYPRRITGAKPGVRSPAQMKQDVS